MIVVVVGLASLKPTTKPQSVNRLPVPVFVFSADNLTVELDASASSDPDGSITNYSWTFGDQTGEGYGVVTSHTYPANGTYEVVLMVTDNGGEKNSTSESVTVSFTIPTARGKPVAVIEVVYVDNWTVVLSGSKSEAADGGVIVEYEWKLGDGGTATGASVTYTYSANGTYDVKLEVTDDLGETNETTVSVTVTMQTEPPPEPPTKYGPPGLLHAIEIHEDKVKDKPQLQNSLDHLRVNLERWLEIHSEPA
jgi:PKD repeat protein